MNIIIYDADINFDSIEFRQATRAINIQIKYVLVEVANFIDLIKRYHVPLRRIYEIIIEELKNQVVIKDIRLQIIVKSINNTAEYNNLIFTLLVFDIFPRIINEDALILLIIERAKIINSVIIEVAKLYITR